MIRFSLSFLCFLLVNTLIRAPYIGSFGFLNEDAALIRFATDSIEQHGFFYWLYHPYGPSVIRPWQLLGLSFQEQIFSGWPLGFHLWSLIVFSLGQALFLCALTPLAGLFGAAASTLMLGLSSMSAEPLYWISDQHDLYLFFFLSLSLLSFRLILLTEKWIFSGTLFVVSLWASFLSNEKGVLLPVLFSLYAVYLWICIPQYRENRLFITVALSIVSFVSYFLFRFYLLGTFIGGYGTGVLPEVWTPKLVWGISLSVLFTPVRQYSVSTSLAAGWFSLFLLGLLIALHIYWAQRRRVLVVGLLFSLVALGLSSLPTLRYLLPASSFCVFSTRLHWLILIVYAFLLSFFFQKSEGCSRKGYVHLFCVCAYLFIAGYSVMVPPRKIMRASRFTEDAYQLFLEHCSCASPQQPQTVGLPKHFATVNAFTESVWMEEYALYRGLPLCESERCKVRFRYNRKGILRAKELLNK